MVHKNSSRHMDHHKLWCSIFLFHSHCYQSTHFCRVHTLLCGSIYPGHNYASLSIQMHTLHIVPAHVHSMDSGMGNLITHLCSTCYIHDSHYLRSIPMNIFHDQLCIVPCGSILPNYSHSHYLCSIFWEHFHTFHIVPFPHSHPISFLCNTCCIHDSHYLWSTPIPTNIFHGQWCIVPCGSMTCDANYSHSHYLCCIFRSILHD